MLHEGNLNLLKENDGIVNDVNLPKYLYGDASRLKQVLIMLVKIAIRSVIDTDLFIAVRYDASEKQLQIQIDDP